jgi:hypothetical protein
MTTTSIFSRWLTGALGVALVACGSGGTPADASGPDTGRDGSVPVDVARPDVTPPPADVTPPPADAAEDASAPPADVTPPPADAAEDASAPDAAPVCEAPRRMCGDRCADLQTDTTHCGRCDNTCPMGQSCVAGACACPVGQTICGGVCRDTAADPMNCGACGTACPAGQSCTMGMCVCPMGQTLCGGACVDTASDTANCGACGTACPASQTCAMGRCACAPGRTACGMGAMMTCVDTQTDTANCGACGTACAMGQTCVMGACACPAGQTFCGGACVDTATANANCGRCGNACGSAQTCAMGACTCPMGQLACGTSCVDAQTDNVNCGRCGNACAGGQTCVMGACVCPAGQTLCSGTCVDLRTNGSNCGACGMACAMGQSCVASLCGTVPGNDTRAGATVINLTAPSTTLVTDTTGATNHTTGPAGCSCTSGRDVFYTFTLAAEEIVYADTLDGNTWDSSLFLQNAMGANLTATPGSTTCSDDSCAGVRSQIVARLAPGQYFLVLSGCSQGRASIRFQHLPTGSGTVNAVTPTATNQIASGTITMGPGRIDGGCNSANGAEDMYYFTTCSNFMAAELHVSTCGGAGWDTVLHQSSPGRMPLTTCNDDFCGLQSSLETQIPAGAGLHAFYVDTFRSRAPGAYMANYRLGACAASFADCTGTCRLTQADNLNCGACGAACSSGQSCTAGACVCPSGATCSAGSCSNLQVDNNHCGACGNVCPSGATCSAGACRFTTNMTDITVSGTQPINAEAASINGARGATTVTVSNLVGAFSAGALVLLHQTQDASGAAGQYEFRRVASMVGTTVTFDAPLVNAYATRDAPFARAQMVRVQEARNVLVPAGTTLTARAWNGNTGGILALVASGTVTVQGTVTMDARGFRGRGHACTYRCGRGFQGEGLVGLGGVEIAANGNGGGGGGRGQDDASGGGGGHASAGINGGNGSGGACAEARPIPGGRAGALAGVADLSGAFFFGGAGGEGGADEDGGFPGAGGAGGGAIVIRSTAITVSGVLSANGGSGNPGNQAACGGTGCGMGGGGGGAGGSVRLQAITTVAFGTNLVRVNAGLGAGATCGTASGGAGSVGRIGVNAPMITGTTAPGFDRN